MIKSNKINVDGYLVKPSYVLKGDEIITVDNNLDLDNKISLTPEPMDLKVIYEDDDILVINKPAGLVVHPGAGNYENTLVNALINYDKNNLSSVSGELRPGIVHRLDKDTSGVIIVAKNNFSHTYLSEQFNNHTIERKYIGLVWGKLRPQSGLIKTFINRSIKKRQLMDVSQTKGK